MPRNTDLVRATLKWSYGWAPPGGRKQLYGPGENILVPAGLLRSLGRQIPESAAVELAGEKAASKASGEPAGEAAEPVTEVSGIGPATAARLAARGVLTLGYLAALSDGELDDMAAADDGLRRADLERWRAAAGKRLAGKDK
jgi:predicted flap endonuclease-1-like 5' DNA nuclease